MRPPPVTSRRPSPRASTPEMIVWQSTRHVVVEIVFTAQVLLPLCISAGSAPDEKGAEWPPRRSLRLTYALFRPSLFLICRAAVKLRYHSRNGARSPSPSATMRLSRKGANSAGVPSFPSCPSGTSNATQLILIQATCFAQAWIRVGELKLLGTATIVLRDKLLGIGVGDSVQYIYSVGVG